MAKRQLTNESVQKLYNRIKSVAAEESYYDKGDDFDPSDVAGGNIDDAFNAGIDEGYVQFARDLLDMLNEQ